MRRGTFILILLAPWIASGAEPAKGESAYPFRTDFANDLLPWYRLKPVEFPPLHSEHRIGGKLVKLDVVTRSGQFRSDGEGELHDFTLLPFASVLYLNAHADLRDVPMGTHLHFSLYQDEKGSFTNAAGLMDDFSDLAGEGCTFRLDSIGIKEGKLSVTKLNSTQKQSDLERRELRFDDKTLLWKDAKQVRASELVVGDRLLVNLTGSSPRNAESCTEIWVGADTHKLVTERQRKKHNAFLKNRGLPAWIDRSEGKKLTITLFSGDGTGYKALFKDEGINPKERAVIAAVANEELRTYNPPVDGMRSKILEIQSVATDCHGCSGQRWFIQPELMLEGFRRGRCIRLFFDGWPIEDMPKGESLYDE